MNKKLATRIKKYKKIRNMNSTLESRWIFMFLELLAFKRKHNHTNVPVKYKENRSLGYWVRRQRYVYSIKKIDGMREELLRLTGFNFRLISYHDWDKMFGKLTAFKEKFGHAHITQNYEDVKLYDWLTYQRKLFWKNKLESQKVRKLKAIGVDMENKTAGRWEKMFKQLLDFRKQHGHLYVCRYYNADQQLINFVKVIRKNKNNTSEERRKQLNRIGLIWNPCMVVTRILNLKRADEAWKDRYKELKAYKRKFGTSRVRVMDKEYSTLGRWVSAQRCRKENLSEGRFRELKKIGFWVDNQTS